VLAAAAVGARCVAFEPCPEVFEWVLQNIALNGVADRVEAHQEAAGCSCRVVAFTSGQDTVNHVVRLGQEREVLTRSVSMTTLDSALGKRCPILLKIDVEGYETEALNGASALLQSSGLCVLIMELAGSGSLYGFDERVLHARMQELGFEACIYEPSSVA